MGGRGAASEWDFVYKSRKNTEDRGRVGIREREEVGRPKRATKPTHKKATPGHVDRSAVQPEKRRSLKARQVLSVANVEERAEQAKQDTESTEESQPADKEVPQEKRRKESSDEQREKRLWGGKDVLKAHELPEDGWGASMRYAIEQSMRMYQ
ncbi:MAG: hypothetical protein Q9227_004457 [Pyrenula ochraceoflavens]